MEASDIAYLSQLGLLKNFIYLFSIRPIYPILKVTTNIPQKPHIICVLLIKIIN